jgi:hypothetical protein
VSEKPIFWLGGKPGKSKEPASPVAESYEPALREACETCGYAVDEYVFALGGFGGWLAHLQRDGAKYRLFWNGKHKQLAFEQAQAHGGWETLQSVDAEDTGAAGFVIAVRELIEERDGA